ncbi:MAG TPA: hypothetical protein VGS06_05620 [Streptosporangiaceae bacterium]|nr:hypothetical protein [Streptosporangiaceae bacterium]HEV2452531.1 hypothetical protein [Streptosporangiaceae bacterium]
MSDSLPPVVVLTPDKTTAYQHGDPLAVTVGVLQPGTVKVAVQVTLADGTPVSGELDLPVHTPASGFQVASATDSLGDSFTVELAEGGASVLRTTLGAPPA